MAAPRKVRPQVKRVPSRACTTGLWFSSIFYRADWTGELTNPEWPQQSSSTACVGLGKFNDGVEWVQSGATCELRAQTDTISLSSLSFLSLALSTLLTIVYLPQF